MKENTKERGMKAWASESAQAMLEFAVSILALITITIAIVSMARAVQIYQGVSAAAREGTRYGLSHSANSQDPISTSAIKDYVTTQAQNAGLDPHSVDVHVSWPSDPLITSGTDILVTVSYPFTPPFVSTTQLTLTGSSRMLVWKQ